MPYPAPSLKAGGASLASRARKLFGCRVWIVCGCWLLAGILTGQAQESVSKEYQVKAAYLYNFAKFVEWPAQTFTNDESPMVIGVFGQDPFGGVLEAIAKKHQINGRAIIIKPVNTVADAAGVHLMFLGATEDKQAAGILAALKDANILTVGESEKFMAAGGMIAFVPVGDKIRFEINTSMTEHHGLKISAQLLKLATSVHKDSWP